MVQILQEFQEGRNLFCFSVLLQPLLIALSKQSNRFFWRMLTQCCGTFIPLIDRNNCHTKQSYQNHISIHVGASAVLPSMAVSGQFVKNPINLNPDVVCFLHLSLIMDMMSCSHAALCSCLSFYKAELEKHQISQGICNIQIYWMVLFAVLYLCVGSL